MKELKSLKRNRYEIIYDENTYSVADEKEENIS
jgi:hypothetical protein